MSSLSARATSLAADLSKDVASAMSNDSSLTPEAAMLKITKEMLANNPFVTPTGCPANTLPPELLAHIFLVGTQMEAEEEFDEDEDDFDMVDYDLKDGWTDEEDIDPDDLDSAVVTALKSKGKVVQGADGAMEVDGNEEEEDEDYEKTLPFQVLVSHVCRHWREVALASPELWSTLHFSEGVGMEKSKTWIERARGALLDIHIDCTNEHDDDDDDDDENDGQDHSSDATTETPESRYAKAHMDCSHPPPLSLTDMRDILDLIVPLVSQWRSLEIITSIWQYMHTTLSRLSECPSAPLLETLQLYHYHDIEDHETFSPAELREPFLIFNGIAPKLSNVGLWAVHLDWDRSLSLLSGLHDFELTYHTEDVRPSYETFAQIIASSPDLRVLSLCGSGPKEHEPETNAWSTGAIEIPELQEFVFCYHKTSYASALIKKLSLPKVNSLAIDFDGEDYTEFVKQLTLPMSNSKKSLLAGLQHMKISGLPCNKASLKDMLEKLANLRTFNINCSGESEEEIFKHLFPQKVVAGGFPHQRIYCPNLECITTTGIDGGQMRSFVEARIAAGVSIKRVMMSEEDDVDEKDANWLRAHLDVLDFFEPSDSEEEFDDEFLSDDEDSDDPMDNDDDA